MTCWLLGWSGKGEKKNCNGRNVGYHSCPVVCKTKDNLLTPSPPMPLVFAYLHHPFQVVAIENTLGARRGTCVSSPYRVLNEKKHKNKKKVIFMTQNSFFVSVAKQYVQMGPECPEKRLRIVDLQSHIMFIIISRINFYREMAHIPPQPPHI